MNALRSADRSIVIRHMFTRRELARVDAPTLRGAELRGQSLRRANLRGHSPLGALWVFCTFGPALWAMLTLRTELLPSGAGTSPVERAVVSAVPAAFAALLTLITPSIARPVIWTTAAILLGFVGGVLAIAAGVSLGGWAWLPALICCGGCAWILLRTPKWWWYSGFDRLCDLREADLREADLTRANLARANMAHARLDDATLSRASLYSTALDGTCLRRCLLEGADLSLGRIDNSDLRQASLRRAQAYHLRLRHSDLGGCDLTGAILRDARLEEVDLRDAVLDGADLRGCRLERVRLEGARYSSKTRFPQGFDPAAAGMRLSHAG
ncbi:MAG: pentapeptide repeat-containing protein [Armatimonadota bacterium]